MMDWPILCMHDRDFHFSTYVPHPSVDSIYRSNHFVAYWNLCWAEEIERSAGPVVIQQHRFVHMHKRHRRATRWSEWKSSDVINNTGASSPSAIRTILILRIHSWPADIIHDCYWKSVLLLIQAFCTQTNIATKTSKSRGTKRRSVQIALKGFSIHEV